MPEVEYSTKMALSRALVWDFVKDMNNWAPMLTGYQKHEILDEKDSIWTLKGDVGPCPGDGLTVVSDGITVNLNGYKVYASRRQNVGIRLENVRNVVVKGGVVHGATDELGFHAVENRHYITDIHATVMHLLGLDARRLEAPGRRRLDIDYGTPIREIMA